MEASRGIANGIKYSIPIWIIIIWVLIRIFN